MSCFGGTVRSEEGMWIVGYVGCIGISDGLHAELLAILHAWLRDLLAAEFLACGLDK